jgi:hypothetical protein
MESGENRLHKSSLESQCKSSVLTDHRNWIQWFQLTRPNQQLLWTDFIMAPTATFVSIKPSLFLRQPTSGM